MYRCEMPETELQSSVTNPYEPTIATDEKRQIGFWSLIGMRISTFLAIAWGLAACAIFLAAYSVREGITEIWWTCSAAVSALMLRMIWSGRNAFANDNPRTGVYWLLATLIVFIVYDRVGPYI